MTRLEQAAWHIKGISQYVVSGKKRPEDVVGDIVQILFDNQKEVRKLFDEQARYPKAQED